MFVLVRPIVLRQGLACNLFAVVATLGLWPNAHAVDDSTQLANASQKMAQSNSVDPLVVAAQAQRAAVMEKAAQATVAVFGLDGGGGGSGVLITPDGYALTNFHVTSACGDHMRCGLKDGRMYDAVIVGVDATGDVSLIKLLGREDFPTASLANSSHVRVGQWCFSSGNPFGLATNLAPSVSLGLVSGVGRYQYPAGTLLEYSDCIQTDAAVNPGNSGGPLFNLAGEVIGINGRCSFEKRGRVNVGVGYAISSNQIKSFLGMLRSGRLVDHATLGATVSTDDTGDVLISNILSTSDAYRRGLRYGDQVVSLADREVLSTNDFKNILGTLPKEWRVPIGIRRQGRQDTRLVRLSGVHSDKQLIEAVAGQLPDAHPQEDPPSEDAKPDSDELNPESQQPDSDQVVAELVRRVSPDFVTVKSMLDVRPGFSNFYFNRLHRDAVWKRIQGLGDFSALGSTWTLSGVVAGETTKVHLEISPTRCKLQIGLKTLDLIIQQELSDLVTRHNEHGLLLGLLAWQQLLQLGPDRIGSTTYVGTVPVYPALVTDLARAEMCDQLQVAWQDTSVRFQVHPTSSKIVSVEVFGDAGQDPVELYFDKYVQRDGQSWPSVIRLQYGQEPFLVLTIDGVSTGKVQTEAAQP